MTYEIRDSRGFFLASATTEDEAKKIVQHWQSLAVACSYKEKKGPKK
jgi:hypothetical protein